MADRVDHEALRKLAGMIGELDLARLRQAAAAREAAESGRRAIDDRRLASLRAATDGADPVARTVAELHAAALAEAQAEATIAAARAAARLSEAKACARRSFGRATAVDAIAAQARRRAERARAAKRERG